MRFWDSSAVIPLLVREPATSQVLPLASEVAELVLWWGTAVECGSALARLRREGVIDVEEETRLGAAVDQLRDAGVEIHPSDRLRAAARRLVRTHPLRAADALQLAAALEWAGTPDGHVLVTLDSRLAEAARLEGFQVLPSAAASNS